MAKRAGEKPFAFPAYEPTLLALCLDVDVDILWKETRMTDKQKGRN